MIPHSTAEKFFAVYQYSYVGAFEYGGQVVVRGWYHLISGIQCSLFDGLFPFTRNSCASIFINAHTCVSGMQCDSFRKVFLSIYFLMVPLVPRVYLIGKINASYRFFSLSRQTVNKNFLVKNERVEFHVTHVVDNNDSSWEREREEGNNHRIPCNVFRKEREKEGAEKEMWKWKENGESYRKGKFKILSDGIDSWAASTSIYKQRREGLFEGYPRYKHLFFP